MIAYSCSERDDDVYYAVTNNYAKEMEEIVSATILQVIMNAAAARAYLRFGLFISFDPPKCTPFVTRKIRLKRLRCNRHGIGLRIRG